MRKTAHQGVTSLGKGRYLVRIWYTHPKTGRNKRAKRIVEASSAADAAQQREELRAALLAAEAGKPKRERLADYAESWLRSKLPTWKSSTRSNNVGILEVHVLPMLGDYWIDAIDERDVLEWRDSLPGKPDSVNSRLRLLKTLLKDASHAHGVADPSARVPAVRVALSAAEDYIPDAGEAAALLEWLRASERFGQWYPLVELLALTGLRFGEATALRWSDVDFAADTITVRRAQWHGHVDHPKSRTSQRAVVLPAQLAATLRAHQLASGRVGGAYVFLGRRGNLHQSSVLQKPMRAALEACGLADVRVSRVKVWRRVHNNLLRRVTSEAVRQALMGHADAEVGLRHYTQVERAEMSAASARVVTLICGTAQTTEQAPE